MTQLGPDSIKRIGVVGAGMIGASWAAYFITRGLDVVVFDPQPNVRVGLGVNRHGVPTLIGTVSY